MFLSSTSTILPSYTTASEFFETVSCGMLASFSLWTSWSTTQAGISFDTTLCRLPGCFLLHMYTQRRRLENEHSRGSSSRCGPLSRLPNLAGECWVLQLGAAGVCLWPCARACLGVGHTVNAMSRDSSSLGGKKIVAYGFAVHQERKGGQEFSSHFSGGI